MALTKLEKKIKDSTIDGRIKNLHKQYRYYDRIHGYDDSKTVTEEDIREICFSKDSKCEHCGCTDKRFLGIDRINNNIGHTKENSICSCQSCNVYRSDRYSIKEYKEKELFKLTKNFMKTSEITVIRTLSELTSLKPCDANRQIKPSRVDKILHAMYSHELLDDTIIVEMNTKYVLGGSHRLAAAKLYYEQTGKIFPLEVHLKDLNGDFELISKYIKTQEANRSNWTISDHITSWRYTEGYKCLNKIMEDYGLTDYRLIQYVAGLEKDRISKNGLDFIVENEDNIRKTIEFMQIALSNTYSSYTSSFTGSESEQMIKLRNTTVAIRQILTRETRNKKVAMLVNDVIPKYSDKYENGFMAYAPIFGNVIFPQIQNFNAHWKKKANSSDIIEMISMSMKTLDDKLSRMKDKKQNKITKKCA